MRNIFVSAITQAAKDDERLLFLSGDLGFKALEPLRDAIGSRFINAGVAEQNMVSVAAGLASQGFRPWIYSIAPFATLRPYEQLRNDVCLHRLPVRVVGNGGGYGYGIMGSSHHSLEDIGCMTLLPGMQALVPSFADDVAVAVQYAQSAPGPVYLRLGKALPGTCPDPSPVWRTLSCGDKAVLVAIGPIVGEALALLEKFPASTFEIVSLARMPFSELPASLVEKIRSTGALVTLEEHYATGGLGQAMAAALLGRVQGPFRFLPLAAQGYPSGRYGSQAWHLRENDLGGAALEARLKTFIDGSHA